MIDGYSSLYVPIVRLYNSCVLNPQDSFNRISALLFGVQSQVFSASAIAFAVRTKDLNFEQLKQDLDSLELVRLWGLRTTIHIYHSNDWNALLSFVSQKDNWYKNKMKRAGIDIDDNVKKALESIRDIDYFNRTTLIKLGIDAEQIGPWGDLLIELNNRGYIFHYNIPNNFFGNTQVVLGKKIEVPKWSDDLKKELIFRFFHAYAPATIRDFSHWCGITIHEAEEYFQLIKNRMTTIMCGNKEYYIEVEQKEAYKCIYLNYHDDAIYILLPKFDPLLLAYHDKSWIVENQFMSRVWRVAGHVDGVVLQYGKAIATWRYKIKAKKMYFEVYPFQSGFSLKLMEKSCEKIAIFLQKHIESIVIKGESI